MEANVGVKKERERKHKFVKVWLVSLSYLALSLNLLTIILGILYVPSRHTALCNLYGVGILVTWCVTLGLVHLTGQRLNRESRVGRKLDRLGYLYYFAMICGAVGMLYGNYSIANEYSANFSANWLNLSGIYVGYFGILLLGAVTAALNIVYKNHWQVWLSADTTYGVISLGSRGWRLLGKGALIVALYGVLAIGLLYTYILLTGMQFFLYEVIVPEYAGSFGFIFCTTALLLSRLQGRQSAILRYSQLAVGVVILIACLLPILVTPLTILRAEENFTTAFAQDWRGWITSRAEEYFLNTPFALPSYYLGMSPKGYQVKQDILYYRGTQGVDDGVELFFDAFLPAEPNPALPGTGSTLVRIHGGAWVTGDKGPDNMMQMNKYFANQGYTVFDIQYGLTTTSSFGEEFSAPDHVKGEFTIDDMVRHIGIFFKYIADHAEEFQVNLNSVFISGGSAGGHLAAVAALSIANGRNTHLFGEGITVKGVIPFYPANGLARSGEIKGSNEIMNPELLVEKNSPPCLIFQGTHDSMVPQQVAKTFQSRYNELGNNECAILWMPYGGHASDLHFAGNFNQVFLYYMERFMYLYK